MAQRERDANAWMRNALKGPGVRLTRVENLVNDGTPDINGTVDSTDFWIETKAPNEPAKLSTKLFGTRSHSFNQDQKNFALAHIKAGGNMWAFLATENRKLLVPGVYIEYLNEMSYGDILKAVVWRHDSGCALAPSASALRAILARPTPTKLNLKLIGHDKPDALQDNPF